MNNSITRGELTLEQLARLLPANESAAIPQTTAYLLNLVNSGLLVPSRSETFLASIYSPFGSPTTKPCTRHFVTWGDIANAADFLPETLQNAPAVRAIIEATGNQPHNVTPVHGNNNQPPTPQAASRKPPSEVLPSDVGRTLFNKSRILEADWFLPDEAPTMQNILEDVPVWVEQARVQKGKPGEKAGAIWNVLLLAKALAIEGGKKKWTVATTRLTRVISEHFPDALAEWEDWAASYG